MPACAVIQLGLTPYDEAWALQDRLAGEIANGSRLPTLLLLEHPHVFTLGRRGDAQHLLWTEDEIAHKGAEVRWVDRGGDITYHGPGQLVGYPLLPLAPAGWQSARLPQADFVGYIRRLETMLIGVLAKLKITASRREELTGVWVPAEEIARCAASTQFPDSQPAKIASIGVKIDARGVSRHGFALNVNPDMSYWQGIVPCGLDGVSMISLADLLEMPPDMSMVKRMVVVTFGEVFDFEMIF
jgi:lipoyl(octanoyl) transferase